MIFVCDDTTRYEMFSNKIFGLPESYIREMKRLHPNDSALFLFDKSNFVLSGVYVPTSNAKRLIKEDVWMAKTGSCKFPAQIRFTNYCKPTSVSWSSPYLPGYLQHCKGKAKFLDKDRTQYLLRTFAAIQEEELRSQNLGFVGLPLDQRLVLPNFLLPNSVYHAVNQHPMNAYHKPQFLPMPQQRLPYSNPQPQSVSMPYTSVMAPNNYQPVENRHHLRANLDLLRQQVEELKLKNQILESQKEMMSMQQQLDAMRLQSVTAPMHYTIPDFEENNIEGLIPMQNAI